MLKGKRVTSISQMVVGNEYIRECSRAEKSEIVKYLGSGLIKGKSYEEWSIRVSGDEGDYQKYFEIDMFGKVEEL